MEGGAVCRLFFCVGIEFLIRGGVKGGIKMYCQECGQLVGEGAKFCQHCGKKIELAEQIQDRRCEECKEPCQQAMKSLSKTPRNQRFSVEHNKNGNPKIGGWLYLIAALLILRMIYAISITTVNFTLVQNVYIRNTEIFPFLVSEFAFSIFIFIYNIFILKIFFQTKKSFPNQCIWFVFCPVIFSVVEILVLYLSNINAKLVSDTLSGEISYIFWCVLAGAILGVYLNQSKRVEQTFVK